MSALPFTSRLLEVSDRDVQRLAEHFLEPAESFDAATLGDHTLFPLEMTWFYGEPIWHELSHEKQLMLNRLSFCQSYLSTAVAEVATNALNFRASLDTILDGQRQAALYMAREAVEETTHIQAFLCIIEKVLAHYKLTMDQLHTANVALVMARRYVTLHTLLGWLRGDLHYYYLTRFALNVNQKTVERCTIDDPSLHPVVRAVLRNHAIDEARHMQMSRATGIESVARMRNPLGKTLACLAYAHFAASIYIGRHPRDSRLRRETRIRTLELCGVPRRRAEQAYVEWHRRLHQPEDPPLVRAGRAYYLRCNSKYIESLDVSERLKRRMLRILGGGYRDLSPVDVATTPRMAFEELRR